MPDYPVIVTTIEDNAAAYAISLVNAEVINRSAAVSGEEGRATAAEQNLLTLLNNEVAARLLAEAGFVKKTELTPSNMAPVSTFNNGSPDILYTSNGVSIVSTF